MARLWTCGAELQSATSGVEWDTTTGTVSISTSIKRSGAASIRCNPTAGTGFLAHRYRADGTGRVFFRMYLYIATAPSADTPILAQSDGSAHFPQVVLSTTRTLQMHNGTTTFGSASSALSVGVWYRVELDYNDAVAGNTTGLYVDGVLVSSASGPDLAGGGIVRVGPAATCTTDLYFDDIAVNDSTGTAQAGLPGSGKVVHLWPDSAGDNNAWAVGAGGTAGTSNNFTRVNEIPPDITSYNTRTSGQPIDDFNVGSSAGAGLDPADAVTLVAVGQRAGATANTAAAARQDILRIKGQASGTVVTATAIPVHAATGAFVTHQAGAAASFPKTYRLTAYGNPQTGAAWTAAGLDSMQIGVQPNSSSTTEVRVSSLWALVEYIPAGDPLSSVVDNFNDNVIDTALWSANYGGVAESGGQAVVDCDVAQYSAFATAARYSLNDSYFFCKVVPAAVNGATDTAYTAVVVTSATPGTDIAIAIDPALTTINFTVRVEYEDPDEDPYYFLYDSDDHAWVQIRAAEGLLLLEASPDGATWTTMRREALPAWAGPTGKNLKAVLESHRESGTDNTAAFDNVNVPPANRLVAVGRAAETSTAQQVTAGKRIVLGQATETGTVGAFGRARALPTGQAAETDTARALLKSAKVPVGQVPETHTAGVLTPVKRRPFGQVSETDTVVGSLVRAKRRTLGQPSSAVTAQTVIPVRARPVGQATEADTVVGVLTRLKRRAVGQVSETDTAQPFGRVKTRPCGQASETDTAQPAGRVKRKGLAAAAETDTAARLGLLLAMRQASETDTAQLFGKAKRRTFGQLSETDTAQPMNRVRSRVLGQPAEADTAGVLSTTKRKTAGQSAETDLAQLFRRQKRKTIGQPSETDTAGTVQPNRTRPLAGTAETDTAQPCTRRRSWTLTQPAEVDLATSGLGKTKVKGFGQATETDTATELTLPGRLNRAGELDAAQPLGRAKRTTGGQPSTVDAAQPMVVVKRRPVGQATESDTALAAAESKRRLLLQATEVDTAQPLGRAKRRTLGQPSAPGAAQPFGRAKRASIGQPVQVDTAGALTIPGRFGQATEVDAAQPFGKAKRRTLGQVTSVGAAQPAVPARSRPVGMATETDTADRVTFSRLVRAAVETDTAQPLGRRKVRIVGAAATTDTAGTVADRKSLTVGQATVSFVADTITRRRTRSFGAAGEVDAARTLELVGREVRVAAETDVAFAVRPLRRLPIGQLVETDMAWPVAAFSTVPTVTAGPAQIAQTVLVGSVTAETGPGFIADTTPAASISSI